MTKYKLTKEKLLDGIQWHYRDFIIVDTRFHGTRFANWCVFTTKLVEHFETGEIVSVINQPIYSNGNGTRKDMIDWVDRYYEEMNDYVTNEMYKVGEA